jgi:N-acyl-phosphatidylethanolamine-hydrolysing phospholipase D
VISHNHYDHMDTSTLQTLNRLHPHIHFFAPLGNDHYLASIGIPEDRFHCLDWWDNRTVTINLPNAVETGAPLREEFKLTCTPAQHFTGRGLLDRFKTLWSTWVVESREVKVFFGGDTGYRTVLEGENEDEVPVCPAFKEIGDKFGGFDLAFIPIGSAILVLTCFWGDGC